MEKEKKLVTTGGFIGNFVINFIIYDIIFTILFTIVNTLITKANATVGGIISAINVPLSVWLIFYFSTRGVFKTRNLRKEDSKRAFIGVILLIIFCMLIQFASNYSNIVAELKNSFYPTVMKEKIAKILIATSIIQAIAILLIIPFERLWINKRCVEGLEEPPRRKKKFISTTGFVLIFTIIFIIYKLLLDKIFTFCVLPPLYRFMQEHVQFLKFVFAINMLAYLLKYYLSIYLSIYTTFKIKNLKVENSTKSFICISIITLIWGLSILRFYTIHETIIAIIGVLLIIPLEKIWITNGCSKEPEKTNDELNNNSIKIE